MFTIIKKARENNNGTKVTEETTISDIGSEIDSQSENEGDNGVSDENEGRDIGSSDRSANNGMVGRSERVGLIDKLMRRGRKTDFDEERRELAGRIDRAIRDSKRVSKYISSVFFKGTAVQDSRILLLFKNRANNSIFKWFVEHGDHYHVVHDCTYSNGSCRCFAKFNWSRKTRRIITTQDLSREDIDFLVKYHFADGRNVKNLEVRGIEHTELFSGLEGLQPVGDTTGEGGNPGDVEVCFKESEILWNKFNGLPSVEFNNETDSRHDGVSNEERGTQRSRRDANNLQKPQTQEKLEKLILAIGKVPLHDFITTEEFISSNWRFMNHQSVIFKNAINTVKLKFYNMRLRDYRHFYENLIQQPYWDTSTREEFYQKYMTIEMSKKYCLKLLILQCCPEGTIDDDGKVKHNYDWKKDVWQYVNDLILLLDKERHKKNTDVYVSPPNAGKTLFFDMVRDYFINCGQMLNWNRNSNFPLQTCGFTRVIFWNEPNYETSVERNLLKLLGGDSLNAAIKNQMDVNISKTPVIVTSNNYPFPTSKEFEYRIKKYYWKSAPFLINVKGKKFHPLTFQWLITECENYYQDDITHYMEKYPQQHVTESYLNMINLYDLITVDEDNDDENEVVSDNESVISQTSIHSNVD